MPLQSIGTRRFAVLMPGARLHYAVPALLAKCGSLQCFYTDIHGEHKLLRFAARHLGNYISKPAARLFGRRLPDSLKSRLDLVLDNPFRILLRYVLHACFGSMGMQSYVSYVDDLIVRRAMSTKFRGANSLYTCLVANDGKLVELAKRRGMHVIHELFISIDNEIEINKESRRYQIDEESGDTKTTAPEATISAIVAKWRYCDLVLVPSEYCRDTAVSAGCDPSKLRVVPYGIPEHWLHLVPETECGRFLFVGQVGLRKGSHYLAHACRLLQADGLRFECRVVGPHLVDVSNPLFAGPTYVGQVPRASVCDEFRRADVFVLPTLAEGMALVHLEAMACGVPVITTPNCGSVVRDGIDGFIVPIRDSHALADRMQRLLHDRALRERMGAAARQRAREFTWARYGERLMAAIPLEQ